MRRLLAAAIAAALILPVAASGAERPYDHVWRIEGLYVGDAGATSRNVNADRMTLEFADGEWHGSIELSDILAIEEASGFTQSQEASISLVLEGGPAEGGTTAAGRFTGVAELKVREARSIDDALKPSASGAVAVYDLSGFWAAKLDGDVADGQLVYQSARRREGSKGPVRDADWFNRVPDEGIDATGQPQPFTIAVEGVDPDSGGTGGVPAEDDGSPEERPGFFDYVRRGLGGAPVARPLPVSATQAAAARALKQARPESATELPASAIGIDSEVTGAYLDAKNRAAGLLDRNMVPTGPASEAGRSAVKSLYASVPGRPAPGEGEDPATVLKAGIVRLLKAPRALPGAEQLLSDVSSVPANADPDTVNRLRTWLSTAESVAGPMATQGDLIAAAGQAAEEVANATVPNEGPLADAVLAAADDPSAPASARQVPRFEREPSLDASGAVSGDALPNRVLSVAGVGGPPPAIAWSGGASSVQPESWPAYRRGDGAVYWLAGDDGVAALTESTLHGWAWLIPRASLVDSARVGRVYERYPLP